MNKLAERGDYLFKAVVDFFFKRSPVVYFVGGVLGLAGAVLSGGISLDVSKGAIRFEYSNDITVLSCVLVLACLGAAYAAVRMQMKERMNALTKELQKIQHEHEKEMAALDLKLREAQQKAANTHANQGAVSNSLLQRIERLANLFAGYIGAGMVNVATVDGVPVDQYIARVVSDQSKFSHLLNSDPELKAAWTKMLSDLLEAQAAISRSFAGDRLDPLPLANAAQFMSKFIEQVSRSGHLLTI